MEATAIAVADRVEPVGRANGRFSVAHEPFMPFFSRLLVRPFRACQEAKSFQIPCN